MKGNNNMSKYNFNNCSIEKIELTDEELKNLVSGKVNQNTVTINKDLLNSIINELIELRQK